MGRPLETHSNRPQAIGNVTLAQSASVGSTGAAAGTTLFSGDTVEVGAGGNALLMLAGGMPVRVTQKSRARLARTAEAIEVELLRGSVQFRTSASSPVIGRLADATLRPLGTEPAVGVIALLSEKTAIVGAEKGELTISTGRDGKSVNLKEGEAVHVALVAQPSDSQDPAATATVPAPSGKRAALMAIIIGGVIGGIAIALTLQGRGLSDGDKGNMVSPFRFP
jgi:ferric-dicitrate binding protein FerR (iron transport regulator)